MTDVCTPTLLPIKPSSDDETGLMHGFGAEASLPLTQNAPAVTHDITRLCWIDVILWDDCHIHADAIRVTFESFFMYFLLSDLENSR